MDLSADWPSVTPICRCAAVVGGAPARPPRHLDTEISVRSRPDRAWPFRRCIGMGARVFRCWA